MKKWPTILTTLLAIVVVLSILVVAYAAMYHYRTTSIDYWEIAPNGTVLTFNHTGVASTHPDSRWSEIRYFRNSWEITFFGPAARCKGALQRRRVVNRLE